MNNRNRILAMGLMTFVFPLSINALAQTSNVKGEREHEQAAASGTVSPVDYVKNAEIVDLSKEFSGYTGTFLLLDEKSGKTICYNPKRAVQRFSPCSTFKIFNALAGLDCGVLKSKSDLEKWDGQVSDRKECNKDHTLESAMRDSVVWYFQRVASHIGEPRMKKYLEKVQYGNMDMSAGLTQFWLGNSLTISPEEQVEFLKKLDERQLPFSANAMNKVSEIIVVKKTDRGELSGKTGTLGRDKENVMGWFVGYVKHEGKSYVFATNIAAPKDTYGRKARMITEKILEERGLL